MTDKRLTIAAAAAYVGISRQAVLKRLYALDVQGPLRSRTVSLQCCRAWKAHRLQEAKRKYESLAAQEPTDARQTP